VKPCFLAPARANQLNSPFSQQSAYIGRMTQPFTGPIAAEIDQRLRAALAPTHLQVIDDSAKHAGHAGHDGRGESHFTVEIVAEVFAGMNRVARQRAVNAALRDLLEERVHALAIRASAPSELSSTFDH
jgi:BolA protein